MEVARHATTTLSLYRHYTPCKMEDHNSYKNVFMGTTLLVFIMMMGFVGSDVAKDREKCGSQLVAVATCLPYVSGEAKSPPPDCCTGFKQVLKDSIECICLLIKDRNDPSLGLQINATRALSLPAACNTPLQHSINDCPAILHLPPNSPDAKIFDDFAKTTNKTSSIASSPAVGSLSGATSTSGNQKNDGAEKWRLIETHMVSELIAIAALHIFINI